MLNILYHQNRLLIAQTTADYADDNRYGGFNLGLHTGDESMGVLANRAKLLQALRKLTDNQVTAIHWLNQIHSELVASPTAPTLAPIDADAWTAGKTGQALAIMTADCVPIVLFSEQGENGGDDCGNVACIHAGWQGLVKGVISQTYQRLPKGNYKALIGACISGKNYEVNQELGDKIVAECVKLGLVGIDESALKSAILLPHANTDKCYLDVGQLTKLQLAHLKINDLTQTIPCSYDGNRAGQYYSHRYATHQHWGNTGRMAMIVVRY